MSKKRQVIPKRPLTSKLGRQQVNLIQELLVKGFSLHQQGDLIAAGEIYAEILKIQPLHFDALHLSGLIAAQSDQLNVATQLITKAILVNSSNSAAYCNLGNVFLNLGGYEQAIENYTKALTLKSNYEEALYSRGLAYQRLSQLYQAETDYKSALSVNPKHIGTLTNLGNVFQLQKRYDEAIFIYGKAIDLNLPFAEPFNNRGNLYHEQRRFEEALADFDKALAINPNYPEALSNRANSFFYLKQYDKALEGYAKAIVLKPNYAEALHNRGNLYRELKLYELAMADYDLALTIKPDYEYLKGVHFATKMNICDWSNLEDEWKAVCEDIERSKKTIAPFMVIPISDSADLQRRVAELWVNDKHPTQPMPIFKSKYQEDQKIRVGYFSADFHEHATMYLMAQLFELHDKSCFETIGFSFGPDKQDSMRARAVAALDQFHDVRDRTDNEIAQFSRDLGVDIAVDLKGFTIDSRSGIFSYRAAPIQINYLGYPGTMGTKFIDYIIADREVIPEQLRHLYSEEIVYLPGCYQVNDRKREISQRIFTREEVGLPNEGFVFCCFNANYKITPTTFNVWMRILKSTPGSVLWLYQDSEISAENLHKEAEIRGVERSRLIFAKKMTLADHLARHRLADLFLDTLPCNAHTTTSDALWTGLPVLTCAGQTFASRVAASLLHAVGMPELVTNNHAEYESLAIRLGANPMQLSALKEKLNTRRLISTLFDTNKFVENLEALYKDLIIQNEAKVK
jgi:predicted O-linked N-acetylglucosamine transferase (SPINDLY family)